MADNDFMGQLPMLIAMATAGQSGQGMGGYNPTHSPAGLNFGNSMGSISGLTGGALGELGPFADMLGMMMAPDLMRQLQSGANVDQVALQRQRTMQREMMKFATTVPGEMLVKGLGMDPNSAAGQTAAKMLPFVSMFAPELTSNIASAVTPNYISNIGAQRLISAGAIQDQAGRVMPGQLEGMIGAMDRLGMTQSGFRDDRFMHGFNRDSFSAYVQFAADQGETDMSMDRPEARRAARERYRAKNLGGRTDDKLSQDELEDMEATSQRDVESEGLVRSASFQAKIGRQIKRMAPGMSDADALQFMGQSNLVASDSKESDSMVKLLRNIEALGNATGQTTQQLVNAGRALQAENGGALTYNMQVAATAKMAERLSTEASRDVQANTRAGFETVSSSRAAKAGASYAGSAYANLEARVGIFGTEEENAEMLKAKQEGPAAFRQFLVAMTTGSTATGKAHMFDIVTREQTDAYMAATVAEEAGQGINTTGLRAGLAVEEAVQRSGGESGLLGQARSKHSKDFASIVQMMYSGSQVEAVSKKYGIPVSEVNGIRQAINRLGMGAENFIGNVGLVAGAAGADTRAAPEAALRAATEDLGEALSAQKGTGQGIIPNLRVGNINSLSDVVESMGYKTPAGMADLMKGVTEDQQKRFIKAGRNRAEAIQVLDSPSATEAEKKAARDKLNYAVSDLANFSIPERDDKVKALLDPAVSGAPAPSAGGPTSMVPASGATKTGTAGMPPAQAGTAPPGTTSDTKTVQQNAKLSIDLSVNGQPLKNTEFELRASQVQGFREVVVNGKTVSDK